jgi:peroxiredoxin
MRLRITLMIAAAALMVAAALAFADDGVKSTQKDPEQSPTLTVGKPAPDFTLTDATGTKHTLSEYKGKFVVLEWVNYGCPFVKKHYNSGNMQELQEKYTEKGVEWLSICSSAPGMQGYFEGDELISEIKEHKPHADAYLVDASGDVGRMYGAKATPNMYVIDPKGILIYEGAIDDTPSVNPDDVKTATNYVSAALDLAMAGKDVKVKATQPYGCSVKYSSK